MNENELKQILTDQHADPEAYSLDGGRPENSLVLAESEGMFAVYWVERGCPDVVREFDDKSEALEFFGWHFLTSRIALRRGHVPLLLAHLRAYAWSFGEWEGTGTLQRAIDSGAGWPSVYRQYPISGRLSHLLSRIAMIQFR